MTSACPACAAGPAASAVAEGPALQFSLPTIHCAACIGKIERGLSDVIGVQAVRVNLSLKRLSVTGPAHPDRILSAIADLGYEAYPLDMGALNKARDVLEPLSLAEDSSTNGADNEQHQYNSKTDLYDLEPCQEMAKAAAMPCTETATTAESEAISDETLLPNIPLGLVLSVCPEIQTYAEDSPRHWHHLVRAANLVRPMMGISETAWSEAKAAMGPEQAAVVLAAMLERFAEIRSPGGYLRNLTAKANAGAFSCGPMVMALMRKAA